MFRTRFVAAALAATAVAGVGGVDDPTVNAFALPGGFIYVTRGILRIYRLIASSPEARWAAYAGAAERAMRSFAPLSDPALLNQVEVQTPLEPGRPIKWVVGRPLP